MVLWEVDVKNNGVIGDIVGTNNQSAVRLHDPSVKPQSAFKGVSWLVAVSVVVVTGVTVWMI